ncbi:MAG TPA: MATE family efflux transporter [Candidatus Mediterraneibacter avicola]|nr:MATE family efflux transporter [Candidatus Mediterraneibacter avicola]
MEQTQTVQNPLGYKKIPSLLAAFAIPSIIATLVSSLYNIVDQVFIGQGVGYLGNAATNVSYPLTTICLAISLLIGIGSASRFSLSLGAGEQEEACRVVGNGICMMLLSGIIYAVLIEIFLYPMLNAFGATAENLSYAVSYSRIIALGMPFQVITTGMSNLIRADGSPKYSMTCMLIGAVINVILDPVFIFIFHLGVAGAAWATIIGQFFSFLSAILYIRKFKSVRLERKHFRLTLKGCAATASLGMSNSLNQVAITLVQVVMNNSLTYYGAMTVYGKDIPLAACGIVMKTNAILLAFFIGLSQGSQPIIGFNYGARQYPRVRRTYRLAITCSFVISSIGFILFQFFPYQIISLFGKGDALYYEFAIHFMRTFLFMVIVNGVQLISSNFFSAIGKPVKGLLLSMTRQVFFLIPLVLILPLFAGIDGILYAGPVADGIAFVVSVALISLEMKKMRQLERE